MQHNQFYEETTKLYSYLAQHIPEGIVPFAKWLIGEYSDAYKEAEAKGKDALISQTWEDLNAIFHDEEQSATAFAWLCGYYAGRGIDID